MFFIGLGATRLHAQVERDSLAADTLAGDTIRFLNKDTGVLTVKDSTKARKPVAVVVDTPGDSAKPKQVKPKTDFLDPVALMNGRPGRTESGYRPEDMLYPDMIERLAGFKMTLGQWGMPYLRYKYGTDAANIDQGHFINPVTGAEDVYFLDPQNGMRYFDTRTPYLNAYYGQGKADAAQMRVDISQNLHPLVNLGALYYRRQCNGVYTNMVTDQNTIGLSSNFHTLDDRYQVFGHWLYQSHLDQINGGVVGILPDSTFFDQGSQPVALTGANLKRRSNAVAYRQFFRITKDTLHAKHTLHVYNGAVVESFLNQFTDYEVSPILNTSLFPVYPSIGDSAFLFDRMRYQRTKVDVGLSYRLQGKVWQAQQRLEFAQEFGRYNRFTDRIALRRTTMLWKGALQNDNAQRAITLDWQYRQTLSNLFRPETFADLEIGWYPSPKKLDYAYKVAGPPLRPQDSTAVIKYHRPLGLVLHTLSYGRNPTLQQAQGQPWPGNDFTANPNFSNRRINLLTFGVELRGQDRWTKSGEQIGNRLRLSAFSTRQTGMIYYAQGSEYVQAGRNEFVTYAGAELKLRVHWKKFYLETETVMQAFGTNSLKLDDQFRKSQPKFYSKSSVFYENKDLAFAHLLRFGLDYYYFSTYDAPYYDPASQAFYAQGASTAFFQFAYPRADVWVSAQVKKAFIFVKFINLLEGLPQLGYFTTMGYPMQIRQLQLGLNWTFFD